MDAWHLESSFFQNRNEIKNGTILRLTTSPVSYWYMHIPLIFLLCSVVIRFWFYIVLKELSSYYCISYLTCYSFKNVWYGFSKLAQRTLCASPFSRHRFSDLEHLWMSKHAGLESCGQMLGAQRCSSQFLFQLCILAETIISPQQSHDNSVSRGTAHQE